MAQSSNGRIVLDPDLLTMGDLRRARETLKRDPAALLDGHLDERATLIVWCVRSRADDSFTWEQAEAVPLAEMQFPEAPPPPPTPEPAKRGSQRSGTAATS
jgi:hypothetical protein